MAKDFYEALGVSKGASDDEIKRAYRKLAHELHPDKGGDPAKFKEVNEAYQTLKDPQKRASYDRFGSTGFGTGQGYEGFNVNFEDLQGFQGGFGDVFDIFFGGGGGGGGRRQAKPEPKAGRNLEISIKISFEESIFGVNKDIFFPRQEICDHCHGTGSEPGHGLRQCLTCSGTGEQRVIRQTFLGTVTQASVCSICKGKGKIPEKFCKKCGGGGIVRNKAELKVKIPAGIKNGSTIRLRGEGDAGETGAASGDLFLDILVEPHKEFTRDGNNIRSEISLDFADAALGIDADVPTVHGVKKIKIPAGTQSGDEIMLKNFGAPDTETNRKGDHIVTVNVVIPKHLSRKQRKLLEEFKEE